MAERARRHPDPVPRPRRLHRPRRRPGQRRDPRAAPGVGPRAAEADRAGRGHRRPLPRPRPRPPPPRAGRPRHAPDHAARPRRRSSSPRLDEVLDALRRAARAAAYRDARPRHPRAGRLPPRGDAARRDRRAEPRLATRATQRPGPASRTCAPSRGCSAGPSAGSTCPPGTGSGPGSTPGPARTTRGGTSWPSSTTARRCCRSRSRTWRWRWPRPTSTIAADYASLARDEVRDAVLPRLDRRARPHRRRAAAHHRSRTERRATRSSPRCCACATPTSTRSTPSRCGCSPGCATRPGSRRRTSRAGRGARGDQRHRRRAAQHRLTVPETVEYPADRLPRSRGFGTSCPGSPAGRGRHAAGPTPPPREATMSRSLRHFLPLEVDPRRRLRRSSPRIRSVGCPDARRVGAGPVHHRGRHGDHQPAGDRDDR